MNEVFVSPGKRSQLAARMAEVGLKEADLVEKFVLGSGSGGQKLNKTSSCVYLKHMPTGFEIKCQRARSRELNRFLARRELCDRIAGRILGEKTRRAAEAAKIRRQKRRRSRRQKERMLDDKHKVSDKKVLRRRVNASGD